MTTFTGPDRYQQEAAERASFYDNIFRKLKDIQTRLRELEEATIEEAAHDAHSDLLPSSESEEYKIDEPKVILPTSPALILQNDGEIGEVEDGDCSGLLSRMDIHVDVETVICEPVFHALSNCHTTCLEAARQNAYEKLVVQIPPAKPPDKASRVSSLETGALVLTDVDGSAGWQTTASAEDADFAELLNSRLLVLKNSTYHIIWQSFDFRTDTLDPGQSFTETNKLTAAFELGQIGSEYHSLAYGYDNVLRMVCDGPKVSSPYWPDPDEATGATNNNSSRLGTIAKSGISVFVEMVETGGDLNLIWQFGVGCCWVYLATDYVEVINKHNDDKQYVWESKADGAFAVSEDTWSEPHSRGTEIRLHLREEIGEYLEESKLKELVKKYSEFINFPIYIWASNKVEIEVSAYEDESTDEMSDKVENEDGNAEKEEDAEAEDKPKTKKVTETVYEWELLNDVKAIWLRSPREVTGEEYTKLYHTLARGFGEDKPVAWSHFTAECDVEFKSLLFVPPKAPHDLYESNYNTNRPNLKLFVRRVFISDEFDDLLPKYLSIFKGLADSDTLPLDVSQEMLQPHSSLKTIKKKLIRKALHMIGKIAEDPDEFSDNNKKEVEESDDGNEKKGKYIKFWNEFRKSIKLSIIEDAHPFETSRANEKLTSLEQKISRMKSSEKDIFYITGISKE